MIAHSPVLRLTRRGENSARKSQDERNPRLLWGAALHRELWNNHQYGSAECDAARLIPTFLARICPNTFRKTAVIASQMAVSRLWSICPLASLPRVARKGTLPTVLHYCVICPTSRSLARTSHLTASSRFPVYFDICTSTSVLLCSLSLS
jgi:hypothetical protein